ncbi:MAG: hypothetical protein HGJ93_08955 [Desulfosarcina sp.]|nr:hypothetical protein [Desulfosarcina sp.]MBC2766071.1 hypothetical protein [Desulfosarcina sp.]
MPSSTTMPPAILGDRRWRFHLTTVNIIGIPQGITAIGNPTITVTITIGAPITGDTIIEVITRIGAPMAIGARGAGNHMTEGITVVREAIAAVTGDGGCRCVSFRNMRELTQDQQPGTSAGLVPRVAFKKA